MPNTDYVV